MESDFPYFSDLALPYCLMRQPDGRYVAVNRQYKPLGFMTKEWVDYQRFPIAFHLDPLTPTLAMKLSYRGGADLDRIYLYGSSCPPTYSEADLRGYLGRLAILLSLTISEKP